MKENFKLSVMGDQQIKTKLSKNNNIVWIIPLIALILLLSVLIIMIFIKHI
jgi:hypothetical protein